MSLCLTFSSRSMLSSSTSPPQGVTCIITRGESCGDDVGVHEVEPLPALLLLLLPPPLWLDDDTEDEEAAAAASGSNHASVTPRQPASESVPSSQCRSALKVVALRADRRSSDWTTSSTTSRGRPGGRAPFRLGRERQSASTQSSVRLLGERRPRLVLT